MLINYSNWFAGYITCFPQLKGTILDRLAPNFEKPRNKKFGGLPLAWHISFMSNTSSNIFLSKFGSKTIAFSCQWSFSGKNPLFFAYFWVKNASKSKFGVCLRLATFLLCVIYQLFILLPKFGSKTIAITCQWSFSGKNPLFCLFLGQKCLLVKNLGFAWGLPHFFYV